MYAKAIKVCAKCKAPKDAQKDYYQRKNGSPSAYCKPCTAARLRQWAYDNPEKAKESARRRWRSNSGIESKRRYHQRLRMKCIEKLGGRCNWREGCGWTDPRCLHIDHVHGNGARDRKLIKGNQTAFYRRVLTDREGNYQLLCANHNWIKRLENREDGNRL